MNLTCLLFKLKKNRDRKDGKSASYAQTDYYSSSNESHECTELYCDRVSIDFSTLSIKSKASRIVFFLRLIPWIF